MDAWEGVVFVLAAMAVSLVVYRFMPWHAREVIGSAGPFGAIHARRGGEGTWESLRAGSLLGVRDHVATSREGPGAVTLIALIYERRFEGWPLIPGTILILVGLRETDILRYFVDHWPLLLVVAGVLLLLRSIARGSSHTD